MMAIAFKGATCYEAQLGRIWIRICYMRGDYWKWRPWRRIAVGWDRA
jgi:hypothetical protein